MVALPSVDDDQTGRLSPFTKKKKSAMTALFDKMVSKQSYSNNKQRCSNTRVLHSSGEDEEEEGHLPRHPYHPSALTTSIYSLSSVPLSSSNPSTASSSSCSYRNRNNHPLASSDSINMWEEHEHIDPLINMKTLVSQLASSISSSKTTFALVQAASSACTSANSVRSKAEEAMAEELHRLSHLQMRLHCALQQLDAGMKQDQSGYETASSNEFMGNLGQRQEAMLKSYEGIISRFHDEIRKKDAVTEALKETLAKSMLKGEKLERRVKALDAKLSSVQQLSA